MSDEDMFNLDSMNTNNTSNNMNMDFTSNAANNNQNFGSNFGEPMMGGNENNSDDDEEEEDEDIQKANAAKLQQEREYDEYIKRKEAHEIMKKKERNEAAEKWITDYKAKREEKIRKNMADNRSAAVSTKKTGFALVSELVDKLGTQVGAKSDLSRFKEVVNKKAEAEKKQGSKLL